MFLLAQCQEVCTANGNATSKCKGIVYYIVCRNMLPTLKHCHKDEIYANSLGRCGEPMLYGTLSYFHPNVQRFTSRHCPKCM